MRRDSNSFGIANKQQHTLAGEARFEGVTLHKAFPGKLLIKPALSNHGIVFKRTDVKASENLVRARWDTVSDTALCTTVSHESGIVYNNRAFDGSTCWLWYRQRTGRN